jgi:hypothetical protein
MLTIPFDQIKLTTRMTPEQVRDRLLRGANPRPWGFALFGFGSGQFSGSIGADRFTIVRNIRYLNSYLPILLGRWRAEESGSSVRVTFVAPMSVVVLGTVLVSVLLLVHNRQWQAAKLFTFMGALIHLACWVAYDRERTKAEAYLRELLDS